MSSKQSALFYNPNVSTLVLKKVIFDERFSCGSVRECGMVCWGPKFANFGVSATLENFEALALGITTLCGVSEISRQVKCWGIGNMLLTSLVGT